MMSNGLKMQQLNVPKPLIVLVGPTAVGKTETSIQLAKKLNAEIISADSRYFYRGMDIGTAKPSKEEMAGVVHHLVDIAEPDDTWSLSLFQESAVKLINKLHLEKKIPLLVGGTGQYVKSVMEAWQMPEIAPNDQLRAYFEQMAEKHGKEIVYEMLMKNDPEAAEQIDYRNLRRSIRALEVVYLTGKKFSDQRRLSASPYSRKIIGLKRDRKSLYERIDQRIELMINGGLEDEVRRLMSKGYNRALASMSGIGYKEMYAYIEGEISLEEAIRLIKRKTRIFVRRQANWFSENDPTIQWFDAETLKIEDLVNYIYRDEGWLLPNK